VDLNGRFRLSEKISTDRGAPPAPSAYTVLRRRKVFPPCLKPVRAENTISTGLEDKDVLREVQDNGV